MRVTAYVIRFIRSQKKRVETDAQNLEPEEIADAEKLLIIQSQTLLTEDKHFGE